MDPKANIERQREIVKAVFAPGAIYNDPSILLTELAELVEALDGWRLKGGFDPYTEGMQIEFNLADTDAPLRSLAGYTVDITLSPEGDTGYPTQSVSIVRIDEDGDVVVCETDDGEPISNATWAIPSNYVQKVTVL